MSMQTPTRTVSEVMRQVKRQFGDESGVQLEDQDIWSWITDAQDAIVTKNAILKAKSTTNSVIGQATYDFATTAIHHVESLHYDGARIPNMTFPEAEETIMEKDPNQVLRGIPVLWYEWAGQFTFWPTPDSVKQITMYYTKKPDPITGDPDQVLSVTDKYFRDVVNYVLQQAYEMDEDWQASQTKAEQFSTSLAEQAEEERTSQHMTYQTITVIDEF